ncbi:MAG: transporter [Acidobacteria bacterium]|nr:transporter [Acidobacteriota bacterium]
MRRTLRGLVALACLLSTAFAASAQDGPAPDGHAPAGVMFDHLHEAGEVMVGYRFSWGRQSGDLLTGTQVTPDHLILHDACQNERAVGHEHCASRPTDMRMQMHMLDLMYAPTDRLTLMLMPQWMTMAMTMEPVEDPGAGHDHMDAHAHAGPHDHSTSGLGDTIFGGLVRLAGDAGTGLHAGVMFSAPTGAVDKLNDGVLTHYMMQPGSGTWDFVPTLTYTARMDRWSWGGQAGGVLRMEEENVSGYRLGHIGRVTGWGSYRWTGWLSTSVRVQHASEGAIAGLDHTGAGTSPPDLPTNYGGRFTDVGVGLNAVVTRGALAGHRLSLEWLKPVRNDVNGFQLRRTQALAVNWSKAF